MFCSNLMVVTLCCVWVFQPLAMQTEALNRLSCQYLQALSCSDGSTVPLCGDNACPSAMQAEVAGLVLLLGAVKQHSQDLLAGACCTGQPTKFSRCGRVPGLLTRDACCKTARSPQAVGCPYQQLLGSHPLAVL